MGAVQLAYTPIDESTEAVVMGAIFGAIRMVAPPGAPGMSDWLLAGPAGSCVGVADSPAAAGVLVVELVTPGEVPVDW